jgi:hypothetical protein
MMRRLRWFGLRSVCLAFVIALVGCGNASMSGRVTFDKKPVVFGSVLIVGSDKIARNCTISEDGSYSMADLPPGEVHVAVGTSDPKSLAKRVLKRPGVNSGLDDRFEKIQGWFPIPEKFGDFNTSGLAYILQRGANAIDIEMK